MKRPRVPVRPLMLSALLGASLMQLPGLAGAADSEGRYAIKGPGVLKCSEFLQEREAGSPRYYASIGWMLGYLTATNQHTAGVYDLLPWQNLKVLAAGIENHCRKSPSQVLHEVGRLITKAYLPRAIKQQSLLVEARVGTNRVLLYAETMRRIQQRLVEEGVLKEAPTGQFDTATEAALRTFQQGHKLKVTGMPDEATLLTLLEKTAG